MFVDKLDQIPYQGSWIILCEDDATMVKVVAVHENEADFLNGLGLLIRTASLDQQFRGFKVTPYTAKLVLQAAPTS